jgi:hypothetical protein
MVRPRLAIASAVFLGALVGLACGNDGGGDEPTYAFTDGKGRQCTAQKYGLVADCKAEPAPAQACPGGHHACFIIYEGTVAKGPSNLAGGGAKPVWNCDACCSDVDTTWTGVSTDCASYTCKTDADCVGPGGTCNAGQCQAP